MGDGLQDPGVAYVVIASSTSSSHVFVLVNAEGVVGVLVLFRAEDLARRSFAQLIAIARGHGRWRASESAMAISAYLVDLR